MGAVRLLMVLVMIVGGWWLYSWYDDRGRAEEKQILVTRHAVQRLTQEVKYRAAMGKVEMNQRGWPVTIDPEWFHANPPQNMLVSPGGPWVEVATEEEYELTDPPMRLNLDKSTAAFWYNPCKGIVRARVGQALSDARAVEIYNLVNKTSVTSLFPMGDVVAPESAVAGVDASKTAK